MGKRTWVVGWVASAALGGCLGAGDVGARCDGAVVAEGTACVMRGPISETGFDCPPLMPYEFGGEFDGEAWVLCSSDPDLQPQEIEDAMAEGGHPDWPNSPNNPTDPDPTDPDPTDPTDPDPADPADPDPTDPTDPGGLQICGDGVIDDAAPFLEVCDDGNNVNGDGCAADCKSAEVCGNAVLDLGEQCDDGNNVNGDFCDAACLVGDGGVPCIDVDGDGICEPTDPDPSDPTDPTDPGDFGLCGDGVVDAEAPLSEVCDDGNNINGDGCSVDCKSLEVCGNAIVDWGEQCDDGNAFDGDGCDATCKAMGCIDDDGDGICE